MALEKFFCLQVVVSMATGTCVLPYSLRKQSWLYKIAAEPYIQSTVEFTQSTMIFKKENIPNKHVFSSNIIHCQNEIGFRRFVTKEIDVNDTSSRYRCIKIIERSKSIVQLAYSTYSVNLTKTLCSGILYLDIRLLVSYDGVQNEFISCPLQSGYNMKITDSFGFRHGCNFMDLPMRFESECLRGEGFILDFRQKDCVDFLPLDQVQTLICLAQWIETAYHFVIARKANNRDLVTFRFPKNHNDSITVNMYTELIVPMDNRDIGSRYFIISLEKYIQTSTCADEYPECANNECSDYAKNQCQKSCLKCDLNRPPTICSFPLRFRGEWYSQSAQSYNNVTIGETEIILPSVGRFTCIVTPGYSRSHNLYSTLSIFYNGCRPRLTCIDIRIVKTNVLGYSISHSFTWPFTSSSKSLCHDAQFREDIHPIFDKYRTNKHVLKPLLLSSSNDVIPIDCKLSSSFKFNATIHGKGECHGKLFQSCNNSTLLHLTFNQCMSFPYTMTYSCVAYIQGHRQNILLLQDLNSRHNAVCLVYSVIHKSQLIMLPSDECDSNSWWYVENLKRVSIMQLTTEKEQEVCGEIPTTATITTAVYTWDSTVTDVLNDTPSKKLYLPDTTSIRNNGYCNIDQLMLRIICMLSIFATLV